MRVQQYRSNSKACLYFFDRRFYRGVMFPGFMEVLTDQKIKDMIWRDGDSRYYSRGVTDPDYCVLKFSAERMRIYQNFKSDSIELKEIE